MMRKYLLIIPDFFKEKVNLQPWRYFNEINNALSAKNNHQVSFFSLISKTKEINFHDKAIQIKFFDKDKIFSRFRIFPKVLDFSPDEVWISASKTSFIYYPFLRKIKGKTNLIIMSPIYSLRQLIYAVINGVKLQSIRSLIIQTLVPSFLFKYFLNSNFIDNVIVISKSNKKFLKKIGVKNEKIKLLSVGVDKNDKFYASKFIEKERKVRKFINREIKILYIGAPRKLRGFDLVLEGFSIARQKGLKANLKILARKDKIIPKEVIKEKLNDLKIKDKVKYVEDNLSKSCLRNELKKTDVIILPFLLVPSEVPISILESMAYGNLVISTGHERIREILINRGITMKGFEAEELSDILLRINNNPQIIDSLSFAAAQYISKCKSWADVHNDIRSL